MAIIERAMGLDIGGSGVEAAVFNDGVLLPGTELGHFELDGRDAELLAA